MSVDKNTSLGEQPEWRQLRDGNLVPLDVISAEWLEELRGLGSGTVVIDEDISDDYVTPAQPLFFLTSGTGRFGLLPEKVERRYNSAGQVESSITGRGLSAILDYALIYPDPRGGSGALYPTASRTEKERAFSWAGWPDNTTGAEWYKTADWTTPFQSSFSNPSDPRRGWPRDWPDKPNGQWVWAAWPTLTRPPGEVSLFRDRFSVTAPSGSDVIIYVAADNKATVWLNGEEIIRTSEKSGNEYGWQQTASWEGRLDFGSHVLAVRAVNGESQSSSPAGVLLYAAATDSSGGITGNLTRSNTTNFVGHLGDGPGWLPSEIISTLHGEAVNRGVALFGIMSLGFDSSTDSYGDAWTTDRINRSFKVGATMAEVAQSLVESGIEWAVNPDFGSLPLYGSPVELSLDIYQRRGSTEPVMITHLDDVATRQDAPSANVLVVPRVDGSWQEVSVTATDRLEGSVSLGSEIDDAAIIAEATAALSYLATPAEAVDVSSWDLGIENQLSLGDSVVVSWGSERRELRCIAQAWRMDSAGRMSVVPELEIET